MQPDHGEGGDVKAEGLVVEDGGEALDDAGLFERAHTAQARRRRDAHLARKLDIGDAPVGEKLAQDQPIGRIKTGSAHVWTFSFAGGDSACWTVKGLAR